jgi:hypothetical protein
MMGKTDLPFAPEYEASLRLDEIYLREAYTITRKKPLGVIYRYVKDHPNRARDLAALVKRDLHGQT